MTSPITPDEVATTAKRVIPDFVFEAFNKLIVMNFVDGVSRFTQDDAIVQIQNESNQRYFEIWWLNVEEAYREVDWIVEYDKPGFNETYPATFTFRKR